MSGSKSANAVAVAVVIAGAVLSGACSPSRLSPVDASPVPGQGSIGERGAPVIVYVQWDRNVSEAAINAAIDDAERAAGGALQVRRQQVGRPLIKVSVNDNAIDAENARRGVDGIIAYTIPSGPCEGAVTLGSPTSTNHWAILHELGHVLIGEHSKFADDVMFPYETPENGQSADRGYSARETSYLRAGLAAGCARIRESDWR